MPISNALFSINAIFKNKFYKNLLLYVFDRYFFQ
jgi:hypothetical protein